MSELGDIYKGMRDEKKRRRAERFAKADDSGWSKHSEHHWYRHIDGKKLNYWPASGLVMIGNQRFDINSKKIREMIADSEGMK